MAGYQEKLRLKSKLLMLIEGYSETDNEIFLIEIRQVTEEIMCYEEKKEIDDWADTEEVVGALQEDYPC